MPSFLPLVYVITRRLSPVYWLHMQLARFIFQARKFRALISPVGRRDSLEAKGAKGRQLTESTTTCRGGTLNPSGFVQPEVAYFHNHPPRLTLLKVMAQGEPDEKLWRERNVCCF
jgi:hypothetical protein